MLNVRLGELVTQAAEVSVGTDTTHELGAGIDDVVTRSKRCVSPSRTSRLLQVTHELQHGDIAVLRPDDLQPDR